MRQLLLPPVICLAVILVGCNRKREPEVQPEPEHFLDTGHQAGASAGNHPQLSVTLPIEPDVPYISGNSSDPSSIQNLTANQASRHPEPLSLAQRSTITVSLENYQPPPDSKILRKFTGTVEQAVVVDGSVLIPAGSRVVGEARALSNRARLSVHFIWTGEHYYDVSTSGDEWKPQAIVNDADAEPSPNISVTFVVNP